MTDTTFTARVHPDGPTFRVSPEQTVLQAALAAGVEWPSACRAGTCRACIARLLAGRVHHVIEWPGLLPEEKADGWILPCVARAQTDLVLQAQVNQSLPDL